MTDRKYCVRKSLNCESFKEIWLFGRFLSAGDNRMISDKATIIEEYLFVAFNHPLVKIFYFIVFCALFKHHIESIFVVDKRSTHSLFF